MTLPRVALETTLLCHGLPSSRALDVAAELDAIVREAGAQPAVIGVLDGVLRWDLSLDDLACMLDGRPVEKIGARGIAGAVARGVSAATTVSATMAIAAIYGIQVFATGGMGGVHRDAATSFDESEDLLALSRYPVAVVSAGAKAILDLPKTLQRLETLSVPVVGYGTTSFAAFYHNLSGLEVSERIDDVRVLARLCQLRFHDSAHAGGVLVVNPVPESNCLPPTYVDAAIAAALAHANAISASGARATPAALSHLNSVDDGRFLETNIAVVKSNAQVAAVLAVAMHDAA